MNILVISCCNLEIGEEASIQDTRVKNIIEELPHDEKYVEKNYLSQIVENKDVLRQMMALQGVILLTKPEVKKVYKVSFLLIILFCLRI